MLDRSLSCLFGATLLGISAWQFLPAQTNEKKSADQDNAVMTVVNKPAPSEADVMAQIKKPIDANFRRVPLLKAVSQIAKNAGTNILIDEQALTEEGVAIDEPVSHQAKKIASARVLDRILEPLGLTWIIENNVVMVTTIIAADEKLITRTYPVGDLIEFAKSHRGDAVALNQAMSLQFVQFGGPPGGSSGQGFGPGGVQMIPSSPGDWLMDLLQTVTDGPWVNIDGSGGTMDYLNNKLVIRQTHRAQAKCERILDILRDFTDGGLKAGVAEVRTPYYPAKEDQAAHQALAKTISIKTRDLPLQQFAEALSKKLGVPIYINSQALTEEGVAVDEPINWELNNIPARSVLEISLEPLGLTAIVEDGRIRITTTIAAAERLYARFHDIRDLSSKGYNGQDLVDTLQNETSGPWIDIDGTGGDNLIPLDGLLTVFQTEKVHRQIAAILEDMRDVDQAAETKKAKEKPADPTAVSTKFYTPNSVNDLNSLKKAITALVAPETWMENDKDAEGQILLVDRTLVVKNCNEVHEKLKKFFADFEKSQPQSQQGFIGGGSFGSGAGFGGGGLGGGGGGLGGGGFFEIPDPQPKKNRKRSRKQKQGNEA